MSEGASRRESEREREQEREDGRKTSDSMVGGGLTQHDHVR